MPSCKSHWAKDGETRKRRYCRSTTRKVHKAERNYTINMAKTGRCSSILSRLYLEE
jgi:hypothetical protein